MHSEHGMSSETGGGVILVKVPWLLLPEIGNDSVRSESSEGTKDQAEQNESGEDGIEGSMSTESKVLPIAGGVVEDCVTGRFPDGNDEIVVFVVTGGRNVVGSLVVGECGLERDFAWVILQVVEELSPQRTEECSCGENGSTGGVRIGGVAIDRSIRVGWPATGCSRRGYEPAETDS